MPKHLLKYCSKPFVCISASARTQPHMSVKTDHSKFFTIEEAATLLPELRRRLKQMRRELMAARDEVILYKRIALAKERAGDEIDEDEVQVLQQKWQAYQNCCKQWTERFEAEGILIRDLERGVLNFPYQTQHGHVYYLSWYPGDDGLFYFHETRAGFLGRKPITVLPD